VISAFIWLAGALAVLACLGVLYQIFGTRRDARLHPPPGRMVDLGSHHLHVLEAGSGAHTIVMEAGLMSTVLSWSELQKELSKSYRVVCYDRAGLGWSELGPMPRTADQIVDELHAMLQTAAISPPYVLVGHSFGGLTMPLFAARYPRETAGMVLVDPVAPAEWNPPSEHDQKQTRIGAKVCRRAAFLCRLGILRLVAFLLTSGAKGPASRLVRWISREAPAESGSVSSPWFTALPQNEKDMARVFWVQGKFALTIASQLENLPASASRVAESPVFCDQPVVILSARTAPEHRQKEHAAMAATLPLGQHVLANNSNHWIMQEQPELVLRAIEHVVEHPTSADTSSVTRLASAHARPTS
jgi:pimeloyl-ACP methyl ester carboxylesterase